MPEVLRSRAALDHVYAVWLLLLKLLFRWFSYLFAWYIVVWVKANIPLVLLHAFSNFTIIVDIRYVVFLKVDFVESFEAF